MVLPPSPSHRLSRRLRAGTRAGASAVPSQPGNGQPPIQILDDDFIPF